VTDSAVSILISYDPKYLTGRLALQGTPANAIWHRLQQAAIGSGTDYSLHTNTIELPWPGILSLIREFGRLQKTLNFRFRPTDSTAKEKIDQFVQQFRNVQEARGQLALTISKEDIVARLTAAGFTKRTLAPFQLRDLQCLLSLRHGANFSVPGAGKTTVTLALHILTNTPGQHLLVVGPKAAFPAWREVVDDCVAPNAPDGNTEPFTILAGSADTIQSALESGAKRFLINYDLMIQVPDIISSVSVTTRARQLCLRLLRNEVDSGVKLIDVGLAECRALLCKLNDEASRCRRNPNCARS
jgi:hypothetical protein